MVAPGPITPARRRCIAALLHRAATRALTPLKNMGFQDWQCRLAVMRFGGNVDAAVSWLVEGGAGSGRDVEAEARRCALEGAPLDVTRELESLREVYTLGFAQTSVDEAIAEKSGDMHAAVCGLFTRGRDRDGGGYVSSGAGTGTSSAHAPSTPSENSPTNTTRRTSGTNGGGSSSASEVGDFAHAHPPPPLGSASESNSNNSQQSAYGLFSVGGGGGGYPAVSRMSHLFGSGADEDATTQQQQQQQQQPPAASGSLFSGGSLFGNGSYSLFGGN